jgi:hypothetical protein
LYQYLTWTDRGRRSGRASTGTASPTTTWPAIARGEQRPPPVPGDAGLYRTPGRLAVGAEGVKPEDAGKHAISR